MKPRKKKAENLKTAEKHFTTAAPLNGGASVAALQRPDLPPDLPDLPPDRLAAPDLQPPDPQGRRPLHNVLHRQPGIGTSATIFVGRHPPSRHSRPPDHHKPESQNQISNSISHRYQIP